MGTLASLAAQQRKFNILCCCWLVGKVAGNGHHERMRNNGERESVFCKTEITIFHGRGQEKSIHNDRCYRDPISMKRRRNRA